MDERVVVTGLGLVTPLGTGVQKTWDALCQGKSGIGDITRFDTTGYSTKIAGEVTDFVPEDFIPKKHVKRLQPFIAYAIAAAQMALEDSGLNINDANADHVGVIMGCGLGGLSILEQTIQIIDEKGPKKVGPFFVPMMIGNMAAGMISIFFGAKGPNLSISTACAAGTHAVGDSYKLIQQKKVKAMIAGGVESVINPTCIAGFNAMKALSVRNDAPQRASRPFDKDRDGFVIGEGSGVLILESLTHARERGSKIYAEIVGYGASGDAYHMVAPPEDGEGAARCMQNALDDAQISPDAIDYINAHGTGTPVNDVCETRAIKRVFQDAAHKIPISSTKSMTGHLLGGAGGIETVFTVLSLKHQTMPPTINLECPDEACDLDYVPKIARKGDLNYALTNSFGFGGTNASIILKGMAHSD